ncbi:MAG: thiamine pyrophosphate-requiring protein [Chloroflexota bacterium]|nr:thiamine pyrophosphate-requiring protein [Chloroflexota bacterium]
MSSLFENVSLAAAHAYFSVTRRPQVVVVHVDVGTQNLGGNLHDAMRGEAGVVILAGRTPYTVDGNAPGKRSRPVNWQQDVRDQIGIVRPYVKWAHELARVDTLHHLVPRAFQIAATEPCGPVYMTAAREVLMQPMDGVSLEMTRRALPAITPAADPRAIDAVAARIADARAPVAVAGRVGRHVEAVADLVALAELAGMAVVDTGDAMSFPASHALSARAEALRDADLVLVLDADVPWLPPAEAPPGSAFVAQIDVDPNKSTIQLWGFPVDMPIQADTAKAIPQLRAALERIATPERRARWGARRDARPRRPRAEVPAEERQRRPLSLDWIGDALGRALPSDAIVVDEAVTSSDRLRPWLRREVPGTYLDSSGSDLGWGLGAALGAKLAAPARDVVALVGDGSFLFGSPVPALAMAAANGAPFLAVVLDNAGYRASQRPVQQLFPSGASVRANAYPAVRFEAAPDHAALARSCHAYGERVEDPAELPAAIDRALRATRDGTAAVLDLVLPSI